MMFVHDDGGRAAAGYKGRAGDCAVRAIAIATELEYADVYRRLFDINRKRRRIRDRQSPRLGTPARSASELLRALGWIWHPTMRVGAGCTVHLRADELPAGRLVVRCSHHLVAVVNGIIHDTHDPSRGGSRCVYGYWMAPGNLESGARGASSAAC